MVAVNEKPVLEVDTVEQWEAWLEANADHDGVRLRLRKKASAALGITYDQALDIALCFGWIDGWFKALDADYHLQVFTPRRSNSPWSQRNRDHVERLTAAGLMREQGIFEVERAKADGVGLKRQETRSRRIAEYVVLLERGETLR